MEGVFGNKADLTRSDDGVPLLLRLPSLDSLQVVVSILLLLLVLLCVLWLFELTVEGVVREVLRLSAHRVH